MNIPVGVLVQACDEIAKGRSVMVVAHKTPERSEQVGWGNQALFVRTPVESGLMSARVDTVFVPEETMDKLGHRYRETVNLSKLGGKVVPYAS